MMSDIPILDILLFKHFFNFSQSYLDLSEIFVENKSNRYIFFYNGSISNSRNKTVSKTSW